MRASSKRALLMTDVSSHPAATAPQIELSWPVGSDWSTHRRRDLFESLERVLKGRAPFHLEQIERKLAAYETEQGLPLAIVPERLIGGALVRTTTTSVDLRRSAASAARRALEANPPERLARLKILDADHDRARAVVDLPPPEAVVHTSVLLTQSLVREQRERSIVWTVANVLVDGVIRLIDGSDALEEVAAEAARDVRQSTGDQIAAVAARRWAAALGPMMVMDLVAWARTEGLPADCTIAVRIDGAEIGPRRTIQELGAMIDAPSIGIDRTTVPALALGRMRQRDNAAAAPITAPADPDAPPASPVRRPS